MEKAAIVRVLSRDTRRPLDRTPLFSSHGMPTMGPAETLTELSKLYWHLSRKVAAERTEILALEKASRYTENERAGSSWPAFVVHRLSDVAILPAEEAAL